MTANSKIEWTDASFNPWTGCTRISPGCDNCYAATMAKRNPRVFGSWDPGAPRQRTSEHNWRQPLAWNRRAAREGRRIRVFCASMADVFDNQAPPEWRADLWALIAATPHLTWMLLTKRPQNVAGMLPDGWGDGWPNVWLGTTVENQAEADRRIPHLLAVPAKLRFLSCEPLLGPVDLGRVRVPEKEGADDGWRFDCLQVGDYYTQVEDDGRHTNGGDGPWRGARVDWVIAGGESGPGARPMHPDWARTLRDQCATAGVPFFFKQWGEWFPGEIDNLSDGNGWTAFPDIEHDPSAAVWEGRWKHNSACGTGMLRVGKARAGRLLDGREHNAVPA